MGAMQSDLAALFASGGLTRQRPHWWRHRVRVWDRLHAHQVAILDHVLDKWSYRHAAPGEGGDWHRCDYGLRLTLYSVVITKRHS
tara:strand:- start:409 stop:663 length:255 start_codon:yes stop_codon:yes gene_type:complete